MKQPLFVKIKSKFKIINEDPDDDTILKTAYCSKAEYMVTGDKYLLLLQEFKGIRTVTVEEMLKILKDK
jgi:predicted nucleic acid-binding protein